MPGVSTPGPTPTRAVIFSLDALCFRERAGELASAAFRDTIARFSLAGDAPELFPIFASRVSQVLRWYHEKPFYRQSEMLREARLAGLRVLGVKPTPAELDDLDCLWGATSAGMRSRPGAVELLEALRGRGLRIGVISNADCGQLGGTLANAGLAQLAHATVCSEEAHSCTPDPLIFYEILRRLDVRPCEALFVGTSPADVFGARVVGVPSALFAAESPRRRDDRGFAPDHLISTLHEVATLVTLPAPAGGPRGRRRAFADHRQPLSLAG